MPEKLSIDSQIYEIEYTLVEMRRWHAHEVNARHIKRDLADLHEQHLDQVLDTLRWFKREEAFIREAFKARKEANDAARTTGVDRRDT